MDTTKLKKWADLLLDTGKRNNLINFKNSKTSTVEVISPEFSTFFSCVEHTSCFEVYDPKLENEEEYFDVLINGEEKQCDEVNISKDEYLSVYEKKLKRQQKILELVRKLLKKPQQYVMPKP